MSKLDDLVSETTTPLPPAPAGWFDHRYALLCDGQLALVRADRDFHFELARWHERVRGGDRQAQHPNPRGARLRLSRFDGTTEAGAIEVPFGHWPTVDCLADGRWLVASVRAAPEESNAHLFTADGTPAGVFAMGDGINHIRCAPDGTIWVGYFDEGVFSNPHKDGSFPVSSSGIARFDRDGSVLWRFNGEDRKLFVIDCYAMALDGNTLWSCPYTDFPIVRVRDGVVDRWKNDIAGASAIAVDGDHVLLAGGYKENANRIALLHLAGDRARSLGKWRFPGWQQSTAHLMQGQGDTLHIVSPAGWTRLSVAAIRARLRS